MRTAAATKSAGTRTVKTKNDAISLLKSDHRKVEQLFAQCGETEDQTSKHELVHQVCLELIIHTRLEEELFYPVCRQHDVDDELMDEAQVEHDGAKVLIADLLKGSPADDYYDAKVKTLAEYIKHHVAEEEKPRSGIFAKAQKAGIDMNGLGEKLQSRKTELMAESETMTSNPPQPRSFTFNPQGSTQENPMARYSNDRDRDERGRFTDDDNRGYQSRGQYRERDDQGRFTSDDDRGGYQGRGGGGQDRDARGRFTGDYDDDRGSSRGRGHGGWYGDSEGHSRAAEQRGNYGSRSRDYDDDDRGRGYSSQGGRGHGGWYGDPQGHSQASREGWRQSSHEGSGWYGDPQGHSQASREGWEDRGQYGGRQSGRGRDDEDDYRSHSGRGHGGWSSDPEGHSRAAREGWRNR